MDAGSAQRQREEGLDARGWDLSRAVLGDRVGTSHGEGLRWVDADGGSIAAIARRRRERLVCCGVWAGFSPCQEVCHRTRCSPRLAAPGGSGAVAEPCVCRGGGGG